MSDEEFLARFAEVVGQEPSSLNFSTDLQSLEGWDSVAYLGTTVMIDENMGVAVSPEILRRCGYHRRHTCRRARGPGIANAWKRFGGRQLHPRFRESDVRGILRTGSELPPPAKVLKGSGIRTAVSRRPECVAPIWPFRPPASCWSVGPGMRERIDLLIHCTQSPDYQLPTTACLLQDRPATEQELRPPLTSIWVAVSTSTRFRWLIRCCRAAWHDAHWLPPATPCRALSIRRTGPSCRFWAMQDRRVCWFPQGGRGRSGFFRL